MHVRRLWTGASFPLPRSPPIQAPLLSTMRREAHILELLDLLEPTECRNDGGRRVPGSGVGPVDPILTFRRLPELLFQCSSSLGPFAKSSLRRPQTTDPGGELHSCKAGGVWPMPPPHPELLFRDPWRLPEDQLKKLILNAMVIVLNYLELGKVERAPATCFAGRQLRQEQVEHASRLESFLEAWFELGVLTAAEMGRTAGKVEDLERVLLALEAASSSDSPSNLCPISSETSEVELGRLRGTNVGAYKEVEASRLKFRGFPDFDPGPYLDPLSRNIYETPFEHALKPEEFEGPIPRVRVHCSRQERLELFKLLDQSRRIRLFTREQVRQKFGSGVFAVLKSLDADRLILDSRPHNLLEAPPGRYIKSLGSAEPLSLLHLQAGEILYMSSNDIRDFYHLFKVSDQRCRRNSFVGSISPREASSLSCFRPWMHNQDELYVGLACLAMGDTQAVEIAQTCHVGLCIQNRIFDERSILAMNLPPPRQRTSAGIVIDDFVSLTIEARSPDSVREVPTESSRLADRAFDLYKNVKLIPHDEKSVRDSTKAEFWGVSVDGVKGTVRGSLKRAAPLLKVILKILDIGAVTVGLLEIVAGGLISLFIHRRRLLSLPDQVYLAMKGRKQDMALRLWPALYEELLMCAILLPTAVVELRANYSSSLYAVDASNWGEAVVECYVTEKFSKEVCRHSLRRGIWTRLLSPGAARLRGHGLLDPSAEVPGGEDDWFRAHPLWSCLATRGQYRLVWKKAAKRRRHINIGELRAFLKAERLSSTLGRSLETLRWL